MDDLACVGALIRDDRDRVYVHRRSPHRRLFPATWDIVGGHVEDGESREQALAREIEEETGWRLHRIEAVVADWRWAADGGTRHELDYLVEVEGDLAAPRLEAGKHDASAWVGLGDVELLMEGRTDGDRRLRDIVAKVARTRLTDRLRLEPIGPEHVDDLVALHDDPAIAAWYDGATWGVDDAATYAAVAATAWEERGVHRWMAYERGTDRMIGRGGLTLAAVDGAEQLEVGWVVRSELWGQGYATELGRAALRFAFEDLGADHVLSWAELHNERSRAVMDRLGMRHERDGRRDGHEMAFYRLARPEPAPSSHDVPAGR